MENIDLAQCGMIYENIFAIFLNRKDLLDMFMKKMMKCQVVYSHFVKFPEAKKRFTLMRWRYFPNDKGME